jgi:hypothetical protein
MHVDASSNARNSAAKNNQAGERFHSRLPREPRSALAWSTGVKLFGGGEERNPNKNHRKQKKITRKA